MILPVDLISLVRESFYGSEYVYTHGSCYQLFKILAGVFPDARPFYAHGHIITQINGRFYDITGEVDGVGYVPHVPEHGCHNNRFSLWGSAWECPNCDEISDYGTLLKQNEC